MDKKYIDIPIFTSINSIKEKGFTLSATQYKSLQINNKNVLPLSNFLDRKLQRKDLGNEVGSEKYIAESKFNFIKTKAIQKESYTLVDSKSASEKIVPQSFIDMKLKKGDLLISKDSNVGEAVILDRDYPKTMLCGGIYRLPITKLRLYALAFIKSDIFRQQIDFLVPRGSTLQHGKTKFLDCMIPMPNNNVENTIKYVELLVESIINKEIKIKQKHNLILNLIEKELKENQSSERFIYNLPRINKINKLDRMDACLYSEEFQKKEFSINNYLNGTHNIRELGFAISRGQNLQTSNIGKSIRSDSYIKDYYLLILPKNLSRYGTVIKKEYLGNPKALKTLKKGDVIFGAEGSGRSLVIIEECKKTITNIHGITLNQKQHNISKGIYVKLFLDYYRSLGMIDKYAVGGNGGSLAIKYWNYIRFPSFPDDKEKEIVELYYNESSYSPKECTLEDFTAYDSAFNATAGIYELDSAMQYLKEKLNKVINNIVDDSYVEIEF